MENNEFIKSENIPENKPKKPKGKLIFSLLISVFCLIIFAGGASLLTGEDKSFSESENRVLATMPHLSVSSLKDGTFMKDFETYLTDQFAFRDRIIGLKTSFDRILGKTESGGVYIGKDGYLFSVPIPFDEKKTEETADAISLFADSNSDSGIIFMMSPNSSYIYGEKLPDKLSLADQNYLIKDTENCIHSEKIDFVNLSEAFMAKKDEVQLFYKTDHHWTTRAAAIAFEELMKRWEKSTAEVKLEYFTVTDSFQGTLSSKSGVSSSSDIIEICVPQSEKITYVADFENGEKKKATLFDSSKLEQKNKYEVFTGGNYGKIVIDTTSSSKDTLLVIKDSYANCMLPMLTPFFAKIVVVDPRYTEEKLSVLTEENTFSHILFLYNLDTFLADTSLKEVLK
ncbi:MAG: hypothetical protein IKK60_04545 [Clostridia bacterium]|nr:hypothetical protein [Clostridia bacterium]